MSAPAPAPPASRKGQWLALAFVLALAGFTFLCWRDAGRPPVRPVSGGTFMGKDVDGRLVYVNLFELERGWQGWFYREGQGRARWFTTQGRTHPWKLPVDEGERDDGKPPLESTVISTSQAAHLNVVLPRLTSWGSDTANLTRQFEHVSFRRLNGIRFGRVGVTKEYHAQFPQLPETNAFLTAITREIIIQCETDAAEFNSGYTGFWRGLLSDHELPGFNQYVLTANWQLRLLTTNLASFSVWSYDSTGGNGNHSHWAGENFALTETGLLHTVKLADLFRTGTDWQHALRVGCVPKLKAASAPRPEAVFDKDVTLEVFTLSPTGLQIYFNPYAIASGADGEFVVHFDYAELLDMLTPGGPALFLPHAPAEAAK